jgi:divalent metal cation (Fe/Co/Zn/Cd) transporter
MVLSAIPPFSARWRRRALLLVAATAAYNAVEATFAVLAGWRARSIALVGFGLDSVIELVAALGLVWRLRLESRGAALERVERAERRVGRLVGWTFLLLALWVTVQAGWSLWTRAAPEESALGIAIAVASLIAMPLIAWGKLRAARELGSAALRAEARETLACAYLSFTLLLGSR